ncbi:hypothetical protein GMST_28620 [Geomonas silvestris]|uniref:Uncharacterized protein n=1 Tax=Geomonas silvestris TaxID=2740184 RepID=A0A6V8MKY5_9BACT|nr:hypothetical protein [Geomonas silvestris]GFO60537.1 hypothetical protein GMST_28620 [Geomonas silvestris]
MKNLLVALAALILITAGAPAAPAAQPADFEAQAQFAEGNPPVIPHKIVDNANGESCLACHLDLSGASKAPLCPHPVRIYCTSCHVRSDLGTPAAAKKAKKK